jgi:hypothetical protein
MVGERHANEIGERAAIFDAAYRLQAVGGAERDGGARVGVPALASFAPAAADLERHDDEIAGCESPHGVTDLGNDAGGLVPQRKGARQAGLAVDDREIEIAARHRERAHQRVAVVKQFWCGHVPPFDGVAADIGELPHLACLRWCGDCERRNVGTKDLSSTAVKIIHPSGAHRGHFEGQASLLSKRYQAG